MLNMSWFTTHEWTKREVNCSKFIMFCELVRRRCSSLLRRVRDYVDVNPDSGLRGFHHPNPFHHRDHHPGLRWRSFCLRFRLRRYHRTDRFSQSVLFCMLCFCEYDWRNQRRGAGLLTIQAFHRVPRFYLSRGLFSAVSTPIFASEYSCCISFWDLQVSRCTISDFATCQYFHIVL